jgi:hypothetical protein
MVRNSLHYGRKAVRDFLGEIASRKNLKKWVYGSGKTGRF